MVACQSTGKGGYVQAPLSVSVMLAPRKYLGPGYVPVTVYVNTGFLLVFSGPPRLTDKEKPVVPPPVPVPWPETLGWLSCSCSCAQLEKRLDSMVRVLSVFDSGGSMIASSSRPAIATTPVSQKSQRASPISFMFTRTAFAIDPV